MGLADCVGTPRPVPPPGSGSTGIAAVGSWKTITVPQNRLSQCGSASGDLLTLLLHYRFELGNPFGGRHVAMLRLLCEFG